MFPVATDAEWSGRATAYDGGARIERASDTHVAGHGSALRLSGCVPCAGQKPL